MIAIPFYVYMATNKFKNVLYTGVTNSLERRLLEHIFKVADGFTKRYNVNRLVFYEETYSAAVAIEREKQIKSWSRKKKDALVESMNPEWKDLSTEWEHFDRDTPPDYLRKD